MVMFQAMIWYSFCGGGVVGALLYAKIGYLALVLPIVVVGFCAIIYQFRLVNLAHLKNISTHREWLFYYNFSDLSYN